jgi:hypothetical protein
MGQPEERTEEAMKVREVTDIQANWNEEGHEESGKFSMQLILDDGAEEYVIRPTGMDMKVLLLKQSKSNSLYFDTERKVFVINNLPLGGRSSTSGG